MHCAVRLAVAALLVAGTGLVPASAQVVAGHRLPEGDAHPVRDHAIDVLHLGLDLRVDLDDETVAGAAEIRFAALGDGLGTVELDAADLKVSRVTLLPAGTEATFSTEGRTLWIELPEALSRGDERTLRVEYSAHPRSGLYFQKASDRSGPQAWNYGEGGLHYAWLPLYNDTNDRFSVSMDLTVARPYSALSNGTLVETRDNPDGTRTFRWNQDEPIPNYLLALDVGELERVDLGEADVAGRKVPVGAWGPPGTHDALADTFRNVPKMVEFFSERFGYPYAWPRYDQVVLHQFEGAMETTGMVGFTESYIRGPEDPRDSSPYVDLAHPTWATEDTISHELAHHWFGDLLTCRSMGSIWINESFASFSHTLWNEHTGGEDDLTYQRWRYLNTYLGYVHETGDVRPLEYRRYGSFGDMYQEETTYVKGSLVLHMLRRVVGDAGFYASLSAYLHAHEFGAVEASDLLEAIQDTTGRNVRWFFDDWITGGGGHPVFAVSWSWSAERKQVDLDVEQIQADQPFENAFRMPVEVEVVTKSGRTTHTVEVNGWHTQVSLAAAERPVTVTFDKGGWTVDEVRFPRTLAELRAQMQGGGLAEQLRAARQLSEDYPRHPVAQKLLAAALADPKAHWGLRQEAALDLGRMGGEAAVGALKAAATSPDRRVRRAVALALGTAGGPSAAETLRRLATDSAEDVAAVAMASLGHADPTSGAFLKKQLAAKSRWWNVRQFGALTGLAALDDPAYVPDFREHADVRFVRDVRVTALEAWARLAPDDPALPGRLRELTGDRNRNVRSSAIETLGHLHRAEDREFLENFAKSEPDPDLALAAKNAAGEIAAFVKEGGKK